SADQPPMRTATCPNVRAGGFPIMSFPVVLPARRSLPPMRLANASWGNREACQCLPYGPALEGLAQPDDFPVQLDTRRSLDPCPDRFTQPFNILSRRISVVDQEVTMLF